ETEEKTKAPVLRLKGSYAGEDRGRVNHTFQLGEGLIGQAALGQSPMLLTEVPADYIRLKSGLGEGSPLNIIILPVSYKGHVNGVVELASFKPFTPIHQQLLNQMNVKLGIILDN